MNKTITMFNIYDTDRPSVFYTLQVQQAFHDLVTAGKALKRQDPAYTQHDYDLFESYLVELAVKTVYESPTLCAVYEKNELPWHLPLFLTNIVHDLCMAVFKTGITSIDPESLKKTCEKYIQKFQ